MASSSAAAGDARSDRLVMQCRRCTDEHRNAALMLHCGIAAFRLKIGAAR
jgi:hypothetical protein